MLPDVYHAASPLASFDRDGITDDPLQRFCSLVGANTLHKVAAHIATNIAYHFIPIAALAAYCPEPA